jgi:hypothetical protein
MKNVSSFPSASPFFHFSIDDVFRCLIKVTDNHIPLFSHPFFRFLKEIHEGFDVNIGLHLFFEEQLEGKIRNLSEVVDLTEQLAQSGSWLFFGPHALSPDISPYMQSPKDQKTTFANIYREIDRFAGPERHAQSIRLHHYSESYELSSFFHKYGVLTLFSTDRDTTSHRMPESVKEKIRSTSYATYRNQQFVRTHFRVEFLTDDGCDTKTLHETFNDILIRYGFLVFYTHEYELERPEVRKMTRMCMETLKNLSIPSIIQP